MMVKLKSLTVPSGIYFVVLWVIPSNHGILKYPQAEFSHNHALNRSSGFSPFQVVYGMIPRGPLDLTVLPDLTRRHGVAADFVEDIHAVHAKVVSNLQASVASYKHAADVHRRRVVFEVGDQVWAFLTKDRMPARSYNKLKAKKIGPLGVLERINDNAYRLQMPAHITTSDVFIVRHLTPYVSPDLLPDSESNLSNPGGPDVAS